MSLWRTVEASRYTAGKLWLPDLSVDLMARDFAHLSFPFDMHIPQTTLSGANDAITLWICFPESCGADATYAVAAELGITLQCNVDAEGSAIFRIEGGDEITVSGGGNTVKTLTRKWTSGALPAGVTALRITQTGDGNYARRPMGTYGPNCYFRFYEV